MPTRVMRVHAQVMPQPMREKRHARPALENLRLLPPEDAQLQESLDGDLMRPRMHMVPHYALREHFRTLLLHAKNNIVDLPAFPIELSADGECPRDVCRVTVVFPACVEQEIPPPRHALIVFLVVQRRRILARRHDGMIGLLPASVRNAALQKYRFQFALVGPMFDLL